jgi:hypothetical protein
MMTKRKKRSEAELFAHSIHRAYKALDNANRKLASHFDSSTDKPGVISEFQRSLSAVQRHLLTARRAAEKAIEKLSEKRAQITLNKVRRISNQVKNCLAYIDLLLNYSGSLLNEPQLKLISELKNGLVLLDMYGSEFMMKSVKGKLEEGD